jgi:hypothetical protein
MPHLPRMISDIIPLAGAALVFFGLFPYEISLGFADFNYYANLKLIFLIVLAGLLFIDFTFYGPPTLITAIITLILSSLALQNWGFGVLSGILNFILLHITGKMSK